MKRNTFSYDIWLVGWLANLFLCINLCVVICYLYTFYIIQCIYFYIFTVWDLISFVKSDFKIILSNIGLDFFCSSLSLTYIFAIWSLARGFTLFLGLNCMWLLLHCVFLFSSLLLVCCYGWYGFKCICVFLYCVPSSVVMILLLSSSHSLVILVGYHFLLIGCWYMTVWFNLKSCVGRCWFFCLALSSLLCIPICIFATLDRGKVDLVALLDKIFIGDWSWFDRGVFLYTIKHLCRSCPSSFTLWNNFFTIWMYFSARPFGSG